VVEFSGDLSFMVEAITNERIAHLLWMGNLDSNGTTCLRVRRAEDGRHAASRHETLNPVVIEQIPGPN
jgi:hypothetical protein